MTVNQLPSKFRTIPDDCVYRLFYPQIPLIVCAKFGRSIGAMDASACIAIANSPPMVALSIQNKLRTLSILEKSRLFSLNWLSLKNRKSTQKIVNMLGSSIARRDQNKLREMGIDYEVIERVPVLAQSSAFLVCALAQEVVAGDHKLVIGRVKLAKASKDFGPDNYWSFKSYFPALYLGSNRGKRNLSTIAI